MNRPPWASTAGSNRSRSFIANGRKAKLGAKAGPPLVAADAELEAFREEYAIPKFVEAALAPGQIVRAVIGLDGGSTSSKAVLLDEEGNLLTKQYQLSKGNPIVDTKELLAKIRSFVHDQGAELEVIGFGATGYAADVLEESLRADVNIVETVAHMMAAVKYCGDVDVICDIGGQDIKVLFMVNGEIRNFRLSNQCSAGNGMLLQAMANQFGLPVTEYADAAFKAPLSPKFSYGCAVFLDADRVNFQKEGYSKEELLAGLAMVLPKNVWQYVVQIPRLAQLGTRYVLQGGTQYNLAAVKAQVDYIKERVPGRERQGPSAPGRGRRHWRGDRDAPSRAPARVVHVHRPRRRDRSRLHERERRVDDVPFLPEPLLAHVHRHEDARRPDEPLHLRLQLRERHGRIRRSAASARRQAQGPQDELSQPRRLRGAAGLPALLHAGADSAGGHGDL